MCTRLARTADIHVLCDMFGSCATERFRSAKPSDIDSNIVVTGREVRAGSELADGEFYLPGITIEGDCPECGHRIVDPADPRTDGALELYANPRAGVPFHKTTGCDNCGGDGLHVLATVRVTVDFTTMDGTPIPPKDSTDG